MKTKVYNTNAKYRVRVCENIVRISDSYKEWRNNVLKLQGKRCQYCGTTKRLHVHHTVPLSQLVYRFLTVYDDLDVNNSELVNMLTENYSAMWDEGNGIVLCHTCHQIEHPTMLK